MRLHHRLVLGLVLLLGVPACDSGGGGGGGGGASATPDANGVEVSDSGDEPRRTLRLKVNRGDKFASRLTVSTQMKISMAGQPPQGAPLPSTEFVIETVIDDVAANGDISFSYVYTDMAPIATEGIDPAAMEAMRASLNQMKGLRGTGVASATGAIRSGSVDTSAIQDPTVKGTVESVSSQLHNLSTPFPVAAVGEGATWQAKRSAVVTGVQTNTVARYRLVDLSGASYRLEVVEDVTAPPGPVSLPGVPPGATVSVVDYKMKSTGTIAGELSRLLPRDSTAKGAGDIKMKIEGNGQTNNMVQHLEIGLTLKEA